MVGGYVADDFVGAVAHPPVAGDNTDADEHGQPGVYRVVKL